MSEGLVYLLKMRKQELAYLTQLTGYTVLKYVKVQICFAAFAPNFFSLGFYHCKI
jgi:hypothetical protein